MPRRAMVAGLAAVIAAAMGVLAWRLVHLWDDERAETATVTATVTTPAPSASEPPALYTPILASMYAEIDGRWHPIGSFPWESPGAVARIRLDVLTREPLDQVRLETCEDDFPSAYTIHHEHSGVHESCSGLPLTERKDRALVDDAFLSWDGRTLHVVVEKPQRLCLASASIALSNDSSGDDLVPLVPLARVAAVVRASSVAPPASIYGAESAFDGRIERPWSSQGSGEGASIEVRFAEEQRIDAIEVFSGHLRSNVHLHANSGPRTVHLRSGNETRTAGVNLPIAIEPLVARELSIVVGDIARGSKFADVAIAEVAFFDGKRWFSVDVSEAENARAARNRYALARAEFPVDTVMGGPARETVVFHSDGTFHVRAKVDQRTEEVDCSAEPDYCGDSSSWTEVRILGDYAVLTSRHEILIKTFGIQHLLSRHANEGSGDCWIELEKTTDSIVGPTLALERMRFIVTKGRGSLAIDSLSLQPPPDGPW